MLFPATVIKVNNLFKAYDEIYTTVPLFRFVNSTEGLGLEYIKELYSLTLDVEQDSMQRFLNSSVVFYLKRLQYNDIFNPNYLILYKFV